MFQMIRGLNGLRAPQSYWDASREMIESVAGGCGPGGVGDWMVPDTNFGLSMKPACEIHDWMYYEGQTQEGKEIADIVFLLNMLKLVKKGTRFLRIPRDHRAFVYYEAVKYGGNSAYWKGKEMEKAA